MSDRARDPLIEEALRWLVVLRDPSADEADRRAFERWRMADPAHEAAWRAGEMYEKRVKDQEKARQAYMLVPDSSSHYRDAQKKLKK